MYSCNQLSILSEAVNETKLINISRQVDPRIADTPDSKVHFDANMFWTVLKSFDMRMWHLVKLHIFGIGSIGWIVVQTLRHVWRRGLGH